MTQSQLFYTLRPSLIFVADTSEHHCHLRGGDNEIIPLHDINNQNLLSHVFDYLNQQAIVSFSELKISFQNSPVCDKQQALTLATDLQTLINSLIDASLLFTISNNKPLSALKIFLIREGLYTESLFHTLQQQKILIVADSSHLQTELLEIFSHYQLDTCIITLEKHTHTSFTGDMLIGFGNFTDINFFDSIHKRSLQSKIPWFMLRQAGLDLAQIGPIFIPQESACYHCLTLRMNSQRNNPEHHQKFIDTYKPTPLQPAEVWSKSDKRFLLVKAVEEVIRYFMSTIESYPVKTLVGKSQYIDLKKYHSETERVLKLPSCPDCSNLVKPLVAR